MGAKYNISQSFVTCYLYVLKMRNAMKKCFRFIAVSLGVFVYSVSFAKQEKTGTLSSYSSFVDKKDSLGHTLFWTKLSAFCGMAFEGKVTEVADNATFKDKIYVTDFFFTTCRTICPKNASCRISHI